MPGPPASDQRVFKPLPQFPQPPGRRCPSERREAWFPGAGQRRPHPPARPPAMMGRARAPTGEGRQKGEQRPGALGWPRLQPFLTPPPLPAASFLRPPPCTFARAFHVLPPRPARIVHAPPTPSELRGTPPPRPATLSARASHLARFRALFFYPPISPTPPGPAAPPHTGKAWAARRRGGARGARAGPAPRGRKGGGAGAARAVCSRPRARRRRRELREEEEGRELKEQDSPFPDPPFFASAPPHG